MSLKMLASSWRRIQRAAGQLRRRSGVQFLPRQKPRRMGDGGMVTTRAAGIADRVKMLRNYGQREKYKHDFLAINSRLDTLQAAFLRIKLRKLDAWNQQRLITPESI